MTEIGTPVEKKRVLTGDRPTGHLHIGHWVGSIQNRIAFQEIYDCYFIIADLHVLTTKREKQDVLDTRSHIREMIIDYLAAGIDPTKSTIFLQSAIPAIYELNLFFEMMVPLNRLQGLPSIKEMAKNARIEESSIPFGLMGYPILQTADIAAPMAHFVPVGKDNEAHIELSRDILRKFNSTYGEVFPLPEVILSTTPTLIGTDGQGKMSKSAGNTIFLSDSKEIVEKKIRGMYTDPNRIHANVPGTVEGNPVFIYHDIFNLNKEEVSYFKQKYREGAIGDVEIKASLSQAINAFLTPIREKRKEIERDVGYVERVIFEGSERMIEVSSKVLKEVKSVMGISGTWNKISRIARDYRAGVTN